MSAKRQFIVLVSLVTMALMTNAKAHDPDVPVPLFLCPDCPFPMVFSCRNDVADLEAIGRKLRCRETSSARKQSSVPIKALHCRADQDGNAEFPISCDVER
jgi:hypothetical protein